MRTTRTFGFAARRATKNVTLFGSSIFLSFFSSLLSAFFSSRVGTVAALAFAFLLPVTLQAQGNFVYVTNRTATGNTVSGFAVDAGGVLTPVANSPFSTGGTGANVLCAAVDRITVSPSRNLLFVTNSGDQTISVFQIAATNGILTPVAGSPFASGLTLDSCAGISLAATPDGNFLMASSNGTIQTFSVAANGALTLVQTASLLPSPMVGMKISGDGRFLAVSHQSSVSILTIAADGSLAAVSGSPFPKTSTGLISGVEFNCDGTLLYAGEGGAATSITDAWSVAATGALTPIAGSPFSATGSDSNVVFLTPDNTLLYQSNQGSNDLNSFTVNADGTLSSIGSFNIAAGHKPVGLASDNSGLFLYAADDASGLAVFNILPGVVPTLVASNPIAGAGQIQDVAAFPPRSCAHTDLSITQTATPNPVTAGGQITYTITITNNGPATASVAVNDLLPRADMTFVSCAVTPNGVCDKGAGLNRTITFASLPSGASGTVTLVGSTIATLLNQDTITNTASVSNSSAVDTNPANNSSTTNVTVSAAPSATNIVMTPASAVYFGNVTLTAALHRTSPGANIAGRTLSFTVDGVAVGSGITNATGVATVTTNVGTINGGLPVGLHSIGISFAGDNQFAASTATAQLTVTQAVLTVTAQPATKVYGDANPPFTFVISGFLNNETAAGVVTGAPTCSTSAGVTTPAGPQTITCIKATLAATNYSFAFVNGTMTITKAPLVLAGNSVSRVYGDVNPAITGVIQGLKAGDQANATFSTTALTTSPVGSYPINGAVVGVGGFNINNYTVTSSGTVTVTPAPLTATANNTSRMYGDPNPVFTGVVTGVKNGDVFTSTFSSVADPTSPIGTYPIIANLTGAAAANYTVTSNNGVLTVTAAPLTVTAANASRLYGDANPSLTGTVTGVKNTDAITATFTSTAVATSSVGAFPITSTLVDPTAKLGNYILTSNDGSLTVSPAPLSVTATNATRIYGDANPVFSGTITGIKNLDNITATFASAADPTTAVGTSPIIPTLVDPTTKLGNYTVTSNNGILTISPAALAITAANGTRIYGDPNPAFTGTINGLKNGDAITATFASVANAGSPVGNVAIIPTAVDSAPAKLGNYTVTLNNGSLSITPAALAVTAANATRVYGDANPVFNGTLTGVKNADNITASFTTTATAATSVGNALITPVLSDPTAKLGNYTVTSTNGTLTITQAPLTATANNASRVYGDPNPTFTGTLVGVKNSDVFTSSFTSIADPTSPIGTYPITGLLTGAAAGNYSVTSVPGTLTVTVAPLSVSAANASRAYGDPNPAFTGTITGIKNLDNITATFGSAATVATSVGTATIIPTLVDPTGKLGNYSVASSNGTLTITTAALSVTAANATRIYGDANPAFAGTITGLKNADNITATFASAATAATAVGTASIVPTLADPTARLGNYTVTLNNGTLTITAAPLTITGTNASRLYGDPNPAFTGTVTGQKNGDVITATFASVATPASAVGTFPIVGTAVDPAGKLGNYLVISSNGTLAVGPATLTVAAGNVTRLYGDANPAFTGTVTGQKNGDVITATFSTTTDTTSAVGLYPITATFSDPGAKLTNYTVAASGTLTISAAPLSVSAANASRIYGDANPAFTGTLTGLRNGDNISASFTSAGPASAVGTYPIMPVLADPGAKLGNYNVTSSNGTLTVSQAALTVAAANASRPYGSANPALTGTITGIKNADNITANFTSVANAASTVGSYPIVPTLVDPAGKVGNYSVVSTNGTLTVTKATPPVTLNVTPGNSSALLVAIVQNAGSILPSGTVQFSESGVALGGPVSITSTGGAAPQATVSVALTPGSHTITASYSGDATYTTAVSAPVTAVVNAGNPVFALSGTGGNTTATVQAGQTATYNVFLSSQGFSGVVNFNCSGAPAGTTCSINPNTLSLTPTSANVPVTVTVATTLSAHANPKPFAPFKTTMFVFAGVLVGLASRARKQRKHLVLALLAFSTLGGLTACGGGNLSAGNGPTVRPPTTATLTLTGTSGAQTSSVTLNLTINH